MFVTSRRCVHGYQSRGRSESTSQSNVAGREAAEQALENAGVVKPDFVFMFAYNNHHLFTSVVLDLS